MEQKGKSLEYPLSAYCLRKEQAQMFSQSLLPKIHLSETPKNEDQTLHQLLLHVSSMRQLINYQTLCKIPNPKISTLKNFFSHCSVLAADHSQVSPLHTFLVNNK